MDDDFLDVIRMRLKGSELTKSLVVLGSSSAAPSAVHSLQPDTIVVAINNAWRAVPRVQFSIYSDDFPDDRKHPDVGVIGRSSPQYGPAMLRYGGLFHCGATMAIAAGYWAINEFPYSQITYFACDMDYSNKQTHFYGHGTPDPIRPCVTLQNLEAKIARLMYFGLEQNVLFLNGSKNFNSRLVFPRVALSHALRTNVFLALRPSLLELRRLLRDIAQPAIEMEAQCSPGLRRYDFWNEQLDESVWEYARTVDAMWLKLSEPISAFARDIQLTLALK